MSYYVSFILLFLLLAICGCISTENSVAAPVTQMDPEGEESSINVTAAYSLVQERRFDPGFLIIDVRTPEEYLSGYIMGALNIDYYSPDFAEQLDAVNRSKTYLIYCRRGIRGANAVTIMQDLGFTDVLNLEEGITAWTDAGYPVVTGEDKEEITIDPVGAFDLIRERQNERGFIILDVRTPEEFETGYIEDATNIDFYATNFADEIGGLGREGTYLVYCRRGVRGEKAVLIMKDMGFDPIYNLEGGIMAWADAGYPLVTP